MERFVRFIVGGGLLLVTALWVAEFASPGSTSWLASISVAAVGAALLLVGIWTQL